MVAGGVLCALSFVISGILELRMQQTYARVPGHDVADLHLMNNIPCNVSIQLSGHAESQPNPVTIPALDNTVLHDLGRIQPD